MNPLYRPVRVMSLPTTMLTTIMDAVRGMSTAPELVTFTPMTPCA
jgi:hypothetical protein